MIGIKRQSIEATATLRTICPNTSTELSNNQKKSLQKVQTNLYYFLRGEYKLSQFGKESLPTTVPLIVTIVRATSNCRLFRVRHISAKQYYHVRLPDRNTALLFNRKYTNK